MIQQDLAAYDFGRAPNDDLFGEFVAALAHRTQRVLLGQEWTPKVLADAMAEALFDRLGENTPPRFVDMCCGSGSMLVSVAEKTRERLEAMGVDPRDPQYLDYLVNACTGFDIDPLAVVLAKVNWVQTNRTVLEPLDGSRAVYLPVFHADSLFALAPVFGDSAEVDDPAADYILRLFDAEITLPRFLVRPDRQSLFDGLLDGAYGLSLHLAGLPSQDPDNGHVDQILNDALATSDLALGAAEMTAVRAFLASLIRRLAGLKREGRNGVWVFVIRNAYRPGLVAGQFNGVISNPPWLAMSKVGSSPFASVLKRKAARYSLEPPGAAFLHLEMATVFLAHAIDHYLADGGHIVCVLPDTIKNGGQHYPFRAQVVSHQGTRSRINLSVDEMWTVRKGTFKNRAVVVLGEKSVALAFTEIQGHLVPGPRDEARHYVVRSGDRMVWSASPQGDGVVGAYPSGFVVQGADVMPRRLVFFEAKPVSAGRCTIAPIDRGSPNWFLWSDAKKHSRFEPTARTLPDRYVHNVYLSKHLAPFSLAEPSLAVLPITYDDGQWIPASEADMSLNSQASAHFTSILDESDFDSLQEYWDRGINWRSKLRLQSKSAGVWIAVYGAGGGIPAAAYFQAAQGKPPIIDQTLYWAECASQEEAIYFCGVVNSQSLLSRIAEFIPEGEFGDRHLHTLPARAVPEYDPTNARHAAAVACTRALVSELQGAAGASETVASYFTTEVSMAVRRRRLRGVIEQLSSYGAYASACEALYVND